jgi:excisionase family DNA binding protein
MPTTTESPELLTVREAAALLRSSERSLRREIKNNPPWLVRIGMRVYRINRQKLLEGQS